MKKSCVLILALAGCCVEDHEPRTAEIVERYEFGKGYNIIEIQGLRLTTARILGAVGEEVLILPGQVIHGGTKYCPRHKSSRVWSFRRTETETLDEEYIARAVRLLGEIERHE